ncbi:ABC transporter ATP-binding protein [Isoptericola jiangsuensis]|uniref:ABC transporter ATP-binding protein n=1 Tax=Isoptericola jiangsuensis TaxID=548579 RepID=UPI003AAD7A58
MATTLPTTVLPTSVLPTSGHHSVHRTDDAAVRVRGLRKSYGTSTVVDGLDLDIARGEIVAMLGPNGAGKTTTIEILEGHRTRDGGQVQVLGEDPQTGGRLWRARIGVVAQGSRTRADLTVAEELASTARYYPRPTDPEELMDALGLTAHARTRRGLLSAGQRRSLDLALGVVGRPEILFLDEPTTGLDPVARRRCWELLRRLRRQGATVLLTTHDLDEAARLADRVVVVDHGRVVADGPPDHLGRPEARVPVVTWQDGGGTRSQRTTTPTAMVIYLAAMGLDGTSGGEIPDLQVTRPTLEDVYLGLLTETTETTETTAATEDFSP